MSLPRTHSSYGNLAVDLLPPVAGATIESNERSQAAAEGTHFMGRAARRFYRGLTQRRSTDTADP
jgi:hypothetical protein